jgi:molybdate transport repressor ModE-like protein
VAHASVGGRGGGGVVLTEFGSSLVAGYRRLDSSLQPLAKTYLEDFARHLKAGTTGRHIRASIKLKASMRAR